MRKRLFDSQKRGVCLTSGKITLDGIDYEVGGTVVVYEKKVEIIDVSFVNDFDDHRDEDFLCNDFFVLVLLTTASLEGEKEVYNYPPPFGLCAQPSHYFLQVEPKRARTGRGGICIQISRFSYAKQKIIDNAMALLDEKWHLKPEFVGVSTVGMINKHSQKELAEYEDEVEEIKEGKDVIEFVNEMEVELAEEEDDDEEDDEDDE